jgi:hypothetical protein
MSRGHQPAHTTPGEPADDSQLYLALIEKPIRGSEKTIGKIVLDDRKDRDITLYGEILIAGRPDRDRRFIVEELRRISLWSDPLEALGGPVSLAGPIQPIRFEAQLAEEQPAVVLKSFDMRMYYTLLGDLDPECSDSDAVYPQLEMLRGQLICEPVPPTDNQAQALRVTLMLHELIDGRRGAVLELEFGPIEFELVPLQAQQFVPPPHNSLSPCTSGPGPGNAQEQRKLAINFVNLSRIKTSADLMCLAQRLTNGACKVWWEKGGILIDPHPMLLEPVSPIDPGDFRCVNAQGSTLPGTCVAELQEKQVADTSKTHVTLVQDSVEIYLIDHLTKRPGGSITYNCGTSDAFVIIDIEKAEHNVYLLAHEIGHVLGLRHPDGSGCPGGLPLGSYCSVMVPEQPNSQGNTTQNMTSYAMPTGKVLRTLMDETQKPPIPLKCNLSPDPDYGIFSVRDFPYDWGIRPSSPEQEFTDWWTDSDVWNYDKAPRASDLHGSYADGSSMFQDNHAPRHKEPSYMQPNHEPNHMYVRVHACRVPPVGSKVQVYLYLAVPGVSNWPLTPLPTTNSLLPSIVLSGGTLPTPSAPTVGHIIWNVPPNFPPACCVFAVARSENEPNPAIDAILNNPSAHNFYSLFQLLQSDNNVAQRNLHIQSVTPSSSSELWTNLAWVEMSNPFSEPFPAFLEIDTSQAPELATLVLEANDQSVAEIKAGGSRRIALAENLRPEERLILRLRAQVPAHAQEGASFPIALRFFKGDQCISGYRHELRIASFEQTVSQVADTLFGALRDVGVGFDSEDATKLARSVARLARQYRDNPKAALESVNRLSRRFADLAGDLDRVDAPETPLVQNRLYQLAGVLSRRRNRGQIEALVEQIRDLADRIQEPAGRLARRRQVERVQPEMAERVRPVG